MRVGYGDLIGGVSGDMFVAALVDLGLPLKHLKSELNKIATLRCKLEATKKSVHGIRATQFRVICAKQEPERSWKQIRDLIRQSALENDVKETGLQIFSRLAEAEAKVHGVPVDRVHFHEVGATDSIVDIIAAAIGWHHLKFDALHFSPIPLGRGVSTSRHGPLPLPGPATLELLKGLPVVWTRLSNETVTPTGAAIITALGAGFDAEPLITVEQIGYGAGQKDFADRANLFRLIVGTDDAPWKREEMLVIETNIDDMNPEFYDYVLERLLAAGARDVFLSPIQMKKNRPGTLLRVIAEPSNREKLAKILFRETSTIGLRFYPVNRMILKRRTKKVNTRFGPVRVKIIEEPDGAKRVTPEYDDLKRIAAEKKIPLRLLHDEVIKSLRD